MLNSILKENARRNAEIYATFNPITGEGSIGDRVRMSIPDHPLPVQWLPKPMLRVPLMRKIKRAGSIAAFMQSEFPDIQLPEDKDTLRTRIIQRISRIRCRHDFAYWAATYVYIKNKDAGADVLFRLTKPQRYFVSELEKLRLARKPIRIILLKARQWGGSTTSQLYMAWLQLVHKTGLNSLIVSQVKNASINIKEMFRRMLDSYPVELLHEPGEPYDPKEPKLVMVGGSDNTQRVPQRNCTISVGTVEAPDSVRSGDYSLVHLSEVGLWKTTLMRKPEDIVRSACSGVLYKPDTMIVYESTANGVGNFFHSEYRAAVNPKIKSQFHPIFVSWYDIELYRIEFDNEQQKATFAQTLYDNRLSSAVNSNREEPGRYLWSLWQRGATLEAINWYIQERAKYSDHGQMASEYPTDDVEAFVNSGANVFDEYQVKQLEHTCKEPLKRGDMQAFGDEGEEALRDLKFVDDRNGLLHIWDTPEVTEPTDTEYISDRYLTVVDVGGRTSKADYSVIVVFDRLYMMHGRGPSVVAQWYGHIDIDLLAWKAAQIAAYYDNSLLVIESNTIETHDKERHIEGGDQSLFILNQLRSVYPNLYARQQSPDDIKAGRPRKYGFHTNTATKPMIISSLIKIVREAAYTERDKRCLDEYLTYQRQQNGSYAALQGHHDDLLMTRAIGLHIAYHEMEMPQLRPIQDRINTTHIQVISEATL